MKFKLFITVIFILGISAIGKSQELTMFPSFWKMQYYEDKIEIDRSRFESLLESEPKAFSYLEKSKRHRTIAVVATIAEIGFLSWLLNDVGNNGDGVVPLVGTLATAGMSLGFSLSSMKNLKESILTYNDKKTSASINIGPTYNGLGMVLSF
jgi:hypothetical protein